MGHLLYAASSFVHHFIAISEFKLEIQSGNAQLGSKSAIFFVSCDLKIWQMTLKNNRVPLLCYFKLCASFHNLWRIQTGVTVLIRPIWVKIDFFSGRDLEIWRMTAKNNRAPLLSNIQVCASFHYHMWIQPGIMVQKQLNWVLISVTLTFDLDLLHGHHFCHW